MESMRRRCVSILCCACRARPPTTVSSQISHRVTSLETRSEAVTRWYASRALQRRSIHRCCRQLQHAVLRRVGVHLPVRRRRVTPSRSTSTGQPSLTMPVVDDSLHEPPSCRFKGAIRVAARRSSQARSNLESDRIPQSAPAAAGRATARSVRPETAAPGAACEPCRPTASDHRPHACMNLLVSLRSRSSGWRWQPGRQTAGRLILRRFPGYRPGALCDATFGPDAER